MIFLLISACVKLDSFAFEPKVVESIEDYHGLPLYQGYNAPYWIDQESVEQEIYFTPDGVELEEGVFPDEYIHAVFIPAPVDCPVEECPLSGQNITFLYQHGNSGHLFRYWYRAIYLWDLGANVLIYSYRGYGLSKGTPSKQVLLEDSEAAAEYLFARNDIDPEKIVAYGYSMGAIPTSYLAGVSKFRDKFAGVILESGLDSIESILDLSIGTEMPDGYFFEDTVFNGPVFMKDVDLPVLHMHGTLDERVLPLQAENYLEALSDNEHYTWYFGDTSSEPDEWLKESNHRNVPLHSFKGEYHLSDHWLDPANPHHCCIHPQEFEELSPESEYFIAGAGDTTGTDVAYSISVYQELISSWILENLL